MVLLGWLSGAPAAGLVCVLAFAALVRYTVSLHSYSGMATPPMFGDYEAQRHWMEITLHTPLGDWYRQTADNDLQYWGLDYPPLSAYVSWLCGKVAQVWEPASVALLSSRGYETATSKLFMRLSVLVLDAALYFPAAAILCLCGAKFTNNRGQGGGSAARCHALEWLLLLLLQPGLVLIDHGHFQYNAVSLAFTLWAVLAILGGRELFGSALFCLSLCFKTMSLYHAPGFFFFLLSRALRSSTPLLRIAQLGVVVLAVLAVHFVPFCAFAAPEVGCVAGVGQVLHRMFPFDRGLFEDKVANIWCSLSIVPGLKLHQRFETPVLLRISTVATLLMLAPSATALLMRQPRSARSLPLALLNSSLAFFLASFQVHEKSLLLALLPVGMLLPTSPLLFGWFSVLGAFSMYPLLVKDGLVLPYAVCQTLFACLLVHSSLISPNDSSPRHPLQRYFSGRWIRAYVMLSTFGALVIHVVAIVFKPPARYPDLITMLFTTYSCVHLCLLWLYGSVWQWSIEANDEIANEVVGAGEKNKAL